MFFNKIFLAGHNGMVGSAIHRSLLNTNLCNQIIIANKDELDLRNQNQTLKFLSKHKPDYIILAAAKVGGIKGNSLFLFEFLYDNMMIEFNVINGGFQAGTEKLLFLGSSCIYPKLSQQPIDEKELLNGYLENTNKSYAVAKIAGIQLCNSLNEQYKTDYRSIMPSNLYGINDNYDSQNSHVIPALIKKIHNAKVNNKKSLTLWGSGNPLREFLFADDLADACTHIMSIPEDKFNLNFNEDAQHINVGSGKEISINNLAEMVAETVKFKGHIYFDNINPDGTPRKLLNNKRVNNLGWYPKTELKLGLIKTYNDFLKKV